MLNFPVQHHVKATTSFKGEVLEIVDKLSNSKLSSNSSYNVKTMTMKDFVAQRSDMDGVYDAIYFGEGTYNPELPRLNPDLSNENSLNTDNTRDIRTNAHNTTDIMNDITKLKANEIIKDYINKGLLVVFHNSISKQACESKKLSGQQCVLKQSLYNIYKSGYPNVRYIDKVSEFSNLVLENNRPRFQLTSAPKGLTAEFKENDSLVYEFKLLKGSKDNLTVNLYFDANFDNRYSPEEIIKTVKLSDLKESSVNEFEFTYKLAKGYTGPRYWKFEVVNNVGLKQIETNVFKFKGEKLELSVLQVLPNSGAGNLTQVLKDDVISGKKSNVINTSEYKITIDTVKLDKFNTETYQTLNNGKYNMVIFGFEDSYASRQVISTKAANAVRTFAETGQSLFLNHDTFIRKDISSKGTTVTLNPTTNWIEYLFDLSGQTYEIKSNSGNDVAMETKLKNPGRYFAEHNLGWGALAPTTKTNKVNDGVITNYPYNLSSEVAIATTHSQYFSLNLEDPDVIPWYNLKSNNRDNYDSWNHYYIYSRNNVTYSGAGHSSSNFGSQEQQLFVNTMYRAFIGANHQPIITVNSPEVGKSIPSYQKELIINYKIEDLDLTDRSLDTKVFVNGEAKYEKNVPNGSIISVPYEHKLQQGGDVTIRIEATDKKGAKKVEEFTIQIEKVEANLEISREIVNPNETGIYKVGEPITLKYSIVPSDVKITTVDKLRPIAVREGYLKGKEGQQITLYGGPNTNNNDLDIISFSTNNDANSVEASIVDGYGSSLSVNELNENAILFDLVNGEKVGKVVSGLESLTKNQPNEIILPVVEKFERNKPKYTKFARFGELETNNRNGNNFEFSATFLGFLGGESEGFNQDRVIAFKETFPKDISITNSSLSSLKAVSNTLEGEITINYSKVGQVYKAEPLEFTITITPEKKGEYELNKSTLTDIVTKDEFKFNPVFISAKDGLKGIKAPDEIRLNLGGEAKKINVEYDPIDAMSDGIVKEIIWSILDENIATVNEQGTVTPQNVGETKVVLEVKDIFGETIRGEIKVVVFNPILELRAAENISLYVDESKSLDLHLAPETARYDLKWEVGDSSIIQLNKDDGSVKGLQPGDTTVKISGIGIDGEPISTTTHIEVLQKVEKITVSPSPLTLKLGDEYNLNNFAVNLYPTNASNKEFEWVRQSDAYIEFNGNILVATKTGETTITVKSKDGFAHTEVRVIVVSPLDSISFNPNRIKVKKGNSVDVNSLIQKNPGTTTEKVVDKQFKVDNSNLADITTNGKLHAKRLGEVMVEVTAKSESGKPLHATLTVEIVDSTTSGESSSGDKY